MLSRLKITLFPVRISVLSFGGMLVCYGIGLKRLGGCFSLSRQKNDNRQHNQHEPAKCRLFKGVNHVRGKNGTTSRHDRQKKAANYKLKQDLKKDHSRPMPKYRLRVIISATAGKAKSSG